MKYNLIFLVHIDPHILAIYLMSLECICWIVSVKEKEKACVSKLSKLPFLFSFLRRLVKCGTIQLVQAPAKLLDLKWRRRRNR